MAAEDHFQEERNVMLSNAFNVLSLNHLVPPVLLIGARVVCSLL